MPMTIPFRVPSNVVLKSPPQNASQKKEGDGWAGG